MAFGVLRRGKTPTTIIAVRFIDVHRLGLRPGINLGRRRDVTTFQRDDPAVERSAQGAVSLALEGFLTPA